MIETAGTVFVADRAQSSQATKKWRDCPTRPVHGHKGMGTTARVFSQVEREHEHADNDDTPTREKHHILPSGRQSFIRADNVDSKKRKRPSRGRKRWSPDMVASRATLYLSDITKTITGRHDGPCDTDDGMVYLLPAIELMVVRYVAMTDGERNPRPLDSYAWAKRWTPLVAEQHPRAWFQDIEQRILDGFGIKRATLPSADELGDQIRVTQDEFVRFRLRSIGRIDNRAPQRVVAALKAEALQKKEKRKADGKTIPRSESMAQTKPWEAYNVSEPTFRRWVREGKVPPHPSQKKARAANG